MHVVGMVASTPELGSDLAMPRSHVSVAGSDPNGTVDRASNGHVTTSYPRTPRLDYRPHISPELQGP